MTGTVVQLSFWALRCDWPGLTGHGGPCPTEQYVGASVCPCVCAVVQKGTPGYYLPNVTITEPCRSTSPHKHDTP